MIIAQTNFEKHSSFMYVNRLIPYNSVDEISPDECNFQPLGKKLTDAQIDYTVKNFGWEKGQNFITGRVDDAMAKMIKVSQLVIGEKLSFVTLFYVNGKGWMPYRDIKKILEEVK